MYLKFQNLHVFACNFDLIIMLLKIGIFLFNYGVNRLVLSLNYKIGRKLLHLLDFKNMNINFQPLKFHGSIRILDLNLIKFILSLLQDYLSKSHFLQVLSLFDKYFALFAVPYLKFLTLKKFLMVLQENVLCPRRLAKFYKLQC